MNDKQRMLLAFVLSAGILFAWPMIFGPSSSQQPASDTASDSSSDSDTSSDDAKSASSDEGDTSDEAKPKTPARPKVDPAVAVLENDTYRLAVTNRGGRALSYAIKSPSRFQVRDNFFSTLVEDGPKSAHLPFLLTFADDSKLDDESLFEIVEGVSRPEEADDLTTVTGGDRIALRWISNDGSLQVDKRFEPAKDNASPYAIDMRVTVTNHGKGDFKDDLVLSLTGRQDPDNAGGMFEFREPLSAVCWAADSTERVDLDNDTETFSENVQWISIDDYYFVIAALTDEAKTCRLEGTKEISTATLHRRIAVPAGESREVTFALYLGPEEEDRLEAFAPNLDRTIDYGWFEFLSRPLHYIMTLLFGVVGNWGLAILLLTLMIRGAVWPITQKSQDSMMKMKDIQPRIKELQEKYKDNPAQLQQEQLKLFKEEGVNPFGCLPLLLQIPIWFALYRTIYATAELYQAPFLWIKDLSSPDPYYILPIAVGILFALQQYLSSAGGDPKQKTIMYAMSVGFFVMMLFWPAGLNVYIFVSTIVGIAQTLYAKRRAEKAKANKKSGTNSPGGGDSDGGGGSHDNRAEARRAARAARKNQQPA